jgi:predicted metal-dependent hydrolase
MQKKKVRIYNLDINYQIIQKDIEYPRLEFKTGNLVIVAPKNLDTEKLLNKHKVWIYKKQKEIVNISKKHLQLKEKNIIEFKDLVISIIDDYSKNLSFKPKSIYFKTMRSKWASCSQNHNLTFNTLLRFLPDNVIKYVVYHEFLHLKEKRHDNYFYLKINKKFPNHQKIEKSLFTYWFLLQDKINNHKSPDS